jgi:hypothetical protein
MSTTALHHVAMNPLAWSYRSVALAGFLICAGLPLRAYAGMLAMIQCR